MLWWIWIILGFFLMLAELMTPGGFYLLFFGIAGLAVGFLTGLQLSGPLWTQWLLFSILSILSLLLFRRPLLKRLQINEPFAPVDSLLGETAVAVDEIPSEAIGKVELRGTSWNARNAGGSMLSRGQRCRVEKVEGLMLWVRGS